MSFQIRPFTSADYEPYAAIIPIAFPGFKWGAEEIREHDERRDAKCLFGRYVAEVEGRLVGAAEYNQNPGRYHPRKFNVDCAIHPDFHGRGIGSALYNMVRAALEPFDPISLQVSTREDLTQSISFLQNRGFEERMRTWESRLDVTAFDLSPYAGVHEALAAQGIQAMTYSDLQGDVDRDRKVYELFSELRHDVPATEPVTEIPFDRFVQNQLKSAQFLPDALFIAVRDGEYLGLSQLWNNPSEPAMRRTGLTGVRRAHRGRGIALALKLRGIAHTKAGGHTKLQTFNESNNRPMLAINERLGFVKEPAWVDLINVIKAEA